DALRERGRRGEKGARNLFGRQAARLVDVLGLYQKKSTELLRRLGEWTVRGGDRAAPDPDGPRGPRRLQRVRDDVVAAAPDLVVVVERGIDQGLHLHLGQGLEHVLVVVDHEHELHRILLTAGDP